MVASMVRVAVIGCGDIAQKAYLPALTGELKDRARLVGVCDAAPDRARAAGERFGVPAFSDASRLLREASADAAVVLTPLLTHAAVAALALRAGCHAYTEKPLAGSVREAAALVRLAARRRRLLAAAPSVPYVPAIREARRLLDAGRIGKPCLVRVHSSHGGPGGVWATDYSWVYRKRVSGPIPPVFDMGVYGLSGLAALLGPARRVTALSGIAISPRRIEVAGRRPYFLKPDGHDNCYVVLDYGEARLAVVDASYCLRVSEGWPYELYGSEGALFLDPLRGRLRLLRRGRPPQERTLPRGRVSPFLLGLDAFLRAIRGGPRPVNGPEFSLHLVEVMEAAIRAALTGRTVRLRTRFRRSR
jgi:predicted dehydrogenase